MSLARTPHPCRQKGLGRELIKQVFSLLMGLQTRVPTGIRRRRRDHPLRPGHVVPGLRRTHTVHRAVVVVRPTFHIRLRTVTTQDRLGNKVHRGRTVSRPLQSRRSRSPRRSPKPRVRVNGRDVRSREGSRFNNRFRVSSRNIQHRLSTQHHGLPARARHKTNRHRHSQQQNFKFASLPQFATPRTQSIPSRVQFSSQVDSRCLVDITQAPRVPSPLQFNCLFCSPPKIKKTQEVLPSGCKSPLTPLNALEPPCCTTWLLP